MTKVKILMVCLGNICRSPLAEGILKSKLPQDRFFIDSAGTGNWHVGESPDSRSIAIAKKYGVDISLQRARLFKINDFDEFDYIYVMDKSNYQNVIQLAPNTEAINKVKLLLSEIDAVSSLDVPDPYYGGVDGFENVFSLIDIATSKIASKLLSR